MISEAAVPDHFRQYLDSRRSRVENALSGYLREAASPLVSSLADAMRYATLSGGKRTRPLLCLAAAEACGGTVEQALPAACALEMIHSGSLIHDDLPAFDDDLIRRGLPACHVKFSEAVAILAGDALLARAIEVLSEDQPLCTPRQTLRALNVITAALGVKGMAGGQVADMQAEGREVAPAALELIFTLKTGALIRASTMSGAILAGADEDKVAALGTFGNALGLAFQIQDDLLGASGDPTKTGKPIGKDAQRGKATYPGVLGVHESRKTAKLKIEKGLTALACFDDRADPLRRVAISMLDRDQ